MCFFLGWSECQAAVNVYAEGLCFGVVDLCNADATRKNTTRTHTSATMALSRVRRLFGAAGVRRGFVQRQRLQRNVLIPRRRHSRTIALLAASQRTTSPSSSSSPVPLTTRQQTPRVLRRPRCFSTFTDRLLVNGSKFEELELGHDEASNVLTVGFGRIS